MVKHKIVTSLSIISLLILAQLFAGCMTLPSQQVWRPWTRTFNGQGKLPVYSKIFVKVKGHTSSLVGNEDLLQNDIKERVSDLLERRGYRISENPKDYNLLLIYETYRNDKVNSYSEASTRSSNLAVSYNGYKSNAALGIMIASAVFGLANQSASKVSNSTETVESYTHIISLEILNYDSTSIWKGESTWDSYNIDLTTDMMPALQILMSWLPSDKTTYPSVAEVKETKKDNYYNLNCKGRSFSCPALPYKIAFNYHYALETDRNVKSPKSVIDAKAYDAYLDLIHTAEYALPLGDDDYSFPLDEKLWADVEIGGKYLIGNDKQPTNILIKLTGEPTGYKIEKCWIASTEEYRHFETQLFTWQNALKEYYDLRK